MVALIDVCKGIVGEQFQPAGYNIGVNVGETAGQTIMHCHCHVIPRYAGDVRDPRGGVRWVVPKKRGNEITGDVSGHIRHGRDPVFF